MYKRDCPMSYSSHCCSHAACAKDAEFDLIIRYKTASIKMATMMSKPGDKKGEEMEKNKLGQKQNEKKKKKQKKRKKKEKDKEE
uniref:Uncharacterized protein n=1 Tax=Romanomermis culicivorax TaxID=13658 RepID=A0A915J975_ROMCU